MKSSTIRNLVIFLVINAVLAIFIFFNYLLKPKNVVENTPASTTKVAVAPKTSPTVVTPSAPTVEQKTTPAAPVNNSITHILNHGNTATKNLPPVAAPIAKVDVNNQNKVCVEMGPFSLDEKAKMDFILNRNSQTALAASDKRITHQLYWNLGRNKSEAEANFKKQKDGAMSDPKFVLVQNEDKDWIVNIAKVQGSDSLASKLARELEEKARKINAGGTWEYTTLPEGYFYRFEDFNLLKKSTVDSIEITLKPVKEPC